MISPPQTTQYGLAPTSNISACNVSLSNVTESKPCEPFLMNCTTIQQLAKVSGDPFQAILSLLGIVSNVVVILTMQESMRMSGRRTQAKIHLTTLAYSDIAYLMSMMGVGLLSWTCEFCLPCSQVKHCIILYIIMYHLWFFFIIVNRSMTLYISYVRAWSLKNVTNAKISQGKSQRKVLVELTRFTIIFSVPQFLILIPGKVVIPHWSKLNPHTVLAWGVIVYCTSWIIIELILCH